uniref:Uncharacterized protein n=1 Tax=Rhizophora mucronata TaxID=61149 RepID=A0A2P2KAV4_RHIMU
MQLKDKTVRDVALRCRWMSVSVCCLVADFWLLNILLVSFLNLLPLHEYWLNNHYI